MSSLVAHHDDKESSIEQFVFLYSGVIPAWVFDVLRRIRLIDYGAGRVNYKLAADVHLEGSEVECIERGDGYEPHVIFGIKSMPKLAKYGLKHTSRFMWIYKD